MKKYGFKRTIAAVMALLIVGGAMPSTVGGLVPVRTLTASAAESSAVLDAETGVLTLSGNVTYEDVQAYQYYETVLSVVAEEGTVLPASCSGMFARIEAKKHRP